MNCTRGVSQPTRAWCSYDLVKRALDVVLSLLILLLAAPIWTTIAILIRSTSRGPVLFRQTEAIGRYGQRFTLYKFRTMENHASDRLHRNAIERFVAGEAVDADAQDRAVYKIVRDPRVTPLGRILRKVGLDELPQFINVVRGEMSIVGPRPPVSYEYEHYDERARQRLVVRPGITGLYQVSARSKVSFDRMIEIDLVYVNHRSLALDLAIMIRTPLVMLSGRGAH